MSGFDLAKFKSIGFAGTRLREDRETFQRDYERKLYAELDDYAAERKAGAQPDGTTQAAVDRCKAISDALGVAYRGDDRSAMLVDAGLAPPSREWTQTEKDRINPERHADS